MNTRSRAGFAAEYDVMSAEHSARPYDQAEAAVTAVARHDLLDFDPIAATAYKTWTFPGVPLA